MFKHMDKLNCEIIFSPLYYSGNIALETENKDPWE